MVITAALPALAIEGMVVTGGALLFYAGSAKLVAPAPLRGTLTELGVPGNPARMVAGLVALFELAAALAVTILRGPGAALLVVHLGSVFAAVGLWSLATGRRVACNCFGPRSGSATLGWRQVAYLPLWFGLAAAVLTPVASAAAAEARLLSLYAALLGAFLLTARHALGPFLQARSARLSSRVRS